MIMIQMLTSFLGALGFAVLFNVRGRFLIEAAFGGMLGWLCYSLLSGRLPNDYLSFLVAAMLVTGYAEMMARIEKAPATTFLIAGMIPLVPGKYLYYTMRYAIGVETAGFVSQGAQTLAVAIAIAGGVMAASSLFRVFAPLRKTEKN
jgi:uncharacterized membrane protein YjjB (DUF3815 family)